MSSSAGKFVMPSFVVRAFYRPGHWTGLGEFSDMCFSTLKEAKVNAAGLEKHHPGRHYIQILTRKQADIIYQNPKPRHRCAYVRSPWRD